jgi:hypothetical protein
VRTAAFSPDGKTLATGSDDGSAQLWEVTPGQGDGPPTCRPLGPPLPHHDWVQTVTFTPDGHTLVTASLDGKVRLWEVPEPVAEGVERVLLRAEVVAGMEQDGNGVVRVLEPEAWRQRRDLFRGPAAAR